MKKTLVIGSTALDIIINLDKLPSTSEDIHVNAQTLSLGGCAFNVLNILTSFQIPVLFCSPVGTGMYGDFVTAELNKLGIEPFIRIPDKDSGCCYCFVEKNGERTFLSYHGVEYSFQKKWLESINIEEFDSVYICGLEVEEPTGNEIISFLEDHKELSIYFAPGPRITKIDKEKMSRIFALHPILHLNEEEALSFTHTSDIKQAAILLSQETKKPLIVTAGEQGSFVMEQEHFYHAAPVAANVVDTIGAGDSHIGSIIACHKSGYSLCESAANANKVSAKVVETKGALLPKASFDSLSFFPL